MTDWSNYTLSELGKIVTGKTPPTSNPDYYGGPIPFVTPSDMDGRRTINETDRYVSEKGARKVRSSYIEDPAVLVSCIGSDMGKAALVDVPFVSNQQVNSVVVDRRFDRLFVYYNLSARKAEIQFKASGAAQPIMNKTEFGKLELWVPSLDEQIAISGVLSVLDDKIELNRRMNETLEAMARALFKDWFVDFGPTRAKMEGREPYLASELWELFPDKLDDEGKPEGWNFGSIGDLAETNQQSWTARKHPSIVEYVDLSNAKWGNIEATATLAWQDAPSRARRIARAGDTIVGTTRPGNGSFSYISQEGLTVSTGFAVLTPMEEANRDLVYIAATRPKNIKRLANLADGHGGAYPAVKPHEVSATELVLPDGAVLLAFSDLVSPFRQKIEFAKAENRTLAQTRDLLLPRLMSGEIRLREAEKDVGAVA